MKPVIAVPIKAWESIRSSYAQSTLAKLKTSLLELDLKNLSGINRIIANNLQEIFNFIDQVVQVETPADLQNKNLLSIYKKIRAINNLSQASNVDAGIFHNLGNELNTFMKRNIDPHLDQATILQIASETGSRITAHERKTNTDPNKPSQANIVLFLMSNEKNQNLISFDNHILLKVDPKAPNPHSVIQNVQENSYKLFELDPDIRAIIDIFVMNELIKVFPENNLPRTVDIKIKCGEAVNNRIECIIDHKAPPQELENALEEFNKNINSLIENQLIPAFGDNKEILDHCFYHSTLRNLKIISTPPSPESN